MSRASLVIVAVLALVGAACADPTAATDGTLRVEPRASGLRIENASDRPVYYAVYDQQTLALLDWVACTGAGCPSIPARGVTVRACAEIPSCTAATTRVVVYWWRAEPDAAGGFRPDSIRTLVVDLH